MMKGLGISGKNSQLQRLVHNTSPRAFSYLEKATEASWSYVVEKRERWDGLVIKDLC